jgi:hypothetical protein
MFKRIRRILLSRPWPAKGLLNEPFQSQTPCWGFRWLKWDSISLVEGSGGLRYLVIYSSTFSERGWGNPSYDLDMSSIYDLKGFETPKTIKWSRKSVEYQRFMKENHWNMMNPIEFTLKSVEYQRFMKEKSLKHDESDRIYPQIGWLSTFYEGKSLKHDESDPKSTL